MARSTALLSLVLLISALGSVVCQVDNMPVTTGDSSDVDCLFCKVLAGMCVKKKKKKKKKKRIFATLNCSLNNRDAKNIAPWVWNRSFVVIIWIYCLFFLKKKKKTNNHVGR